jgi:Raf kinase inhibitor-like YbhB/YbcL family protein
MLLRPALWCSFLILVGCQAGNPNAGFDDRGVPGMQVTSRAFNEGGTIPTQFSGDGKDVSPPLSWSGAPPTTRSFALICDDPDAPRAQPWVHWVLFNLPADKHELQEGIAPAESLPDGAQQGQNDFGKTGYGGPAPPPGKPHRYYFKIYALDTRLDLQPGATRQQVEKAMKGHILARGELMGTYGRPRT